MADLLMQFLARGQREVVSALDDVKGGLNDVDRAAGMVDESTRKVEGGFARLGHAAVAAGGLLVGAQMVDLGRQAFDASVEVQALATKAETVFGPGIGRVSAAVGELNERLGMSEARLLGVVGGFGDLLVPMGFTRDAAADLSTDALALAGAMSEWSGGTKSVQDAMGALGAALNGEREQLKGYGIVIDETAVQAELAARGLGDLTGEALRQERALVTLELALRQSTDAQDAFAAGGDPAIRAQREFEAASDELMVSLGQGLTPALTSLFGVMGDVAGVAAELPDSVLAGGFALAGLTATLPAINSVKNAVVGLGLASRAFTPWGLALGGVTIGVGLLAQAHLEAKARVEDYTAAIQADQGALGENTRATVLNSLAKRELYRDLGLLGVSTDQFVDAVVGGSQAQTEFRNSLGEAMNAAYDTGEQIVALEGAYSRITDVLGEESEAARTSLELTREREAAEASATTVAAEYQRLLEMGVPMHTAYAAAQGLATDANRDHAMAADDYWASADRVHSAHDGWIGRLDLLRGGEHLTRSAVDQTTEAMMRRLDASRAAVDPVFAATRAQRGLAEAQERLAEVQAAETSTAADVAAAQDDVARAAFDLEGSLVDLRGAHRDGETGGREFRDEMRRQVEQGRITEETYRAIVGQFDDVERAARRASDALAGVVRGAPTVLPSDARQAIAGAGIVTGGGTAVSEGGSFSAVDQSTTVTIAGPVTFGGRPASPQDVRELTELITSEMERVRARR